MRVGGAMTVLLIAGMATGCTYDFEGAFAGHGAEGGQASSAGGSGGEGGATTGAGGSTPTGEQCFNGTDDDGDDLADCEDPECRAAACAPAAPAGWMGPAPLYVGEPAGTPSCPADLTAVAAGTSLVDAPEASCDACDCSTPTGGDCGIGATTIYESNDVCAGNVDVVVTPPMANQCHGFTVGQPSSQALGQPVPVTDPGSCQASGGAATLRPASFVEAALLCSGSAGTGCGDDVCVPAAAAPFGPLCVFSDGDVPCPDETYTDKLVLFTDLADDRGCTSCACGAASGQTCSGTTELYAGSNCLNLEGSVPHDGTTCVSFDVLFPTVSAKFIPGSGPDGGSCPASGGSPTGAATPIDPITVCCLPRRSDAP